MVISIFLYLNILFFTWVENNTSFPYNLDKPDKIFHLPNELNEISGITEIGDNKIACITDEEGIIYIYDLKSEKITSKSSFSGSGDFEDIVFHSNTYYILESNGDITKVQGDKASKHGNPLTKFNNTEGLCYDNYNNRLLISCKNPPIKIYAFNTRSNELDIEPVAHLKEEKFFPTALTLLNEDELLLLSSTNKLGIYSMTKKTMTILPLKNKLFNHAEGMTRLKNGDLLISNEAGKKGNATILLFH